MSRSRSPIRVMITSFLATVLVAEVTVADETVFVDRNATGPVHDGSSWCRAHRELSTAIDSLTAGQRARILVAQGTYLPSSEALEDPRRATFRLSDGLSIEGGYAGCGAEDPSARNPIARPTIVSGDLRGDDQGGHVDDNVYSVFTAIEPNASSELDGLTIVSGNGADAVDSHKGGGIHVEGASLTARACVFRANRSGAGGAVSSFMGDLLFINCIFSGNTATNDGGAIFNDLSTVELRNCTVTGNEALTAGGIRNYAAVVLQLTNSILWGNVANGSTGESAQIINTASTTIADYSLIQGWTGEFGGTGSSGADPRLIDADGQDERFGTADDDLRLSLDSPGIDSGTTVGAPTSDILGVSRPCGGGVDLGAYENDCEAAEPADRWMAVAWNDRLSSTGWLLATTAAPPWRAVGEPLEVGRDTILRVARERVHALSRAEDTVTVVDPESWTVLRQYAIGGDGELRDIAVVDEDTAYVTRATSGHLLRLDLASGDTVEATDLGVFADEDGNPDLDMMEIHEGRLFVQVRRIDHSGPAVFTPPAYLAVVDIASEALVDVDPTRPGVQAIELEGTSPKLKMQIVPERRSLFLSATGGDFDEGGIEEIDLDALRSKGLVVREADGETGAELGPFALVTPERGYLAFSTDLTLSTHLVGFSVADGVDPPPQLFATVGYLSPTLAVDSGRRAFYCPTSGSSGDGVHVFEASTGQRVTADPIPANGPPTDVVLVPARTRFRRGDSNASGDSDISDGIFVLDYLFLGGVEPPCRDAADVDDSGDLDLSDAVYLFVHLFLGGAPPAAPSADCGDDPSADLLTCGSFEPCE